MSTGFDHLVAYHCAPTLMGHKAGSLFSMKRMAFAAQQDKAQTILAMLSQKGLSGQVIHCAGEATLVYLYRKELLLEHLAHPLSRTLLDAHGYSGRDAHELVAQLASRLSANSSFPHEIGLFLGYPPEDVDGFVKHKGLHCKHCGCWKVYGDVGQAKALFGQYATRRKACLGCMNRGMTLDQLVTAQFERMFSMSKAVLVFWSGTGNTEAMAEAIAKGARDAGNDLTVLNVSEADAGKVAAFDKILLGCPAMGAEVLEESEFDPFFTELEPMLSGKKVALFGSYGWGDGEWMRLWEERVNNSRALLFETGLMVNEAPDARGLADCEAFGKRFAQLA